VTYYSDYIVTCFKNFLSLFGELRQAISIAGTVSDLIVFAAKLVFVWNELYCYDSSNPVVNDIENISRKIFD